MELTVAQQRESREFQTLFRNPKHARSMWAQTVYDRYCRPAMKPILVVDKEGNVLPQSQVELEVWNSLQEEFKAAGLNRLPTDGEMMEACQAYYSRHNSASYVARRDSMGAKPVDETKLTQVQENPLQGLSDEELLVLQEALEKHRKKEITDGN